MHDVVQCVVGRQSLGVQLSSAVDGRPRCRADHTSHSVPGDGINPGLDDLIAFSRVPGLLPRSTRSGRPMHFSAVYRWSLKGIAGVRLRFLKIGATSYTTVEWLRTFFEDVTAAQSQGCVKQERSNRNHAQAERLLDAAGI
jgi:hypothetical protein